MQSWSGLLAHGVVKDKCFLRLLCEASSPNFIDRYGRKLNENLCFFDWENDMIDDYLQTYMKKITMLEYVDLLVVAEKSRFTLK